MKNFFIAIGLVFFSLEGQSQASSYTDPAQAYLKLLLEKDASTAVRIGSFKVVGTPYLFGEKHDASVFAKEGKALDVQVSYNTYSQELEIYKKGEVKPIVKDVASVDSFYLQPNNNTEGFKQPLFFVNAAILFSTEKNYFQQVYAGTKFSLYKKYKSALGYVSSNYVQSDLRQFDLSFEYYYSDNIKKISKKIKLNNNSFIKEFKTIKDVTAVLGDESISNNPEYILTKVFAFLNN